MKQHLNTLLIALAIILSAYFLGTAFKNRNKTQESIKVTGLGETDFTSNPVYPFYIADAGHSMKGTTQMETALNLLDTKAYIKSTLRNLIK